VIQPGDEIVVSGLEHHANLLPWQAAARRSGARCASCGPTRRGGLHVADLARLLTPRTRVFAVTACANATGERPPYEALLALAAGAGALTVLDAAQVVAHAVPDLSALACDFMAFSGHKMYWDRWAPVRSSAGARRWSGWCRCAGRRHGRAWVSATEAGFAALPARLEGGTPNVAGAVGLAAAADFIDRTGRGAIDAHVGALRAQAAAGLAALPGVRAARPMPPARPSSRSRPRACTRTTSARCSTSRASPCAPATTARSRCSSTWAWADHARLVRALQHACGGRAPGGGRGACAEGAAMNACRRRPRTTSTRTW
jgi:cysteine desulfurase/selenocysteine lyase